MLPGSSPCELRLMLPDDKLGMHVFHDVLIDTDLAVIACGAGRYDFTAPAMAEDCLQHLTKPSAGCRTPPPGCPETSRQGVLLWWTRFLWRLRYQNLLGPVCSHDSIPPRVGSAVALPCHMVRGVEGIGRACLEHLAEKHGGSTLDVTTKVAKFFPPWTVTREVWHAALRPDVSGVAVDALLFHEAGCRLVHRYRVYKDPFPHPALRDGVIPRLLSCVCPAMAIARLTHLRISIPSSGALPGQVPAEYFPEETAPVAQSRHRRVSFAEEVTMLSADVSPESSQLIPPLILPVVEEVALDSETGVPPLILPVVEELVDDTPAAELFGDKPPGPEYCPRRGFFHSSFRRTMGGWTLMTYVRGSVELLH